MLTLFPLQADHTVQVCGPYELPDALTSRIDAIWTEEKRSRGDRLTNGRIYSLIEHRPDRLLIQPAEYRHALARRRAPELADAGLTVRPLGVTGLLLCADGLVLGRRSDWVAADAGLWEPAPTGGLSRPDPVGQILEELREELGLEPSRIARHDACGLIEDGKCGVIDIVFRLQTTATASEIRSAHAAHATDEYAELAIVPPSDLAEFLQAHHDHLLPALRPMLRLAGFP